MSTDAIDTNMENRGERKAFNSLIEGEFRPLKISKDVRELFEIKASQLGIFEVGFFILPINLGSDLKSISRYSTISIGITPSSYSICAIITGSIISPGTLIWTGAPIEI